MSSRLFKTAARQNAFNVKQKSQARKLVGSDGNMREQYTLQLIQ